MIRLARPAAQSDIYKVFAFARNFSPHRGAPIAVDLGASRLRVAQVEGAGDGELRLVAAASCEVPADAFDSPKHLRGFLTRSLKGLISKGEFRGRSVVLALPSPLVYIRHFRVPRGDDAQTAAQLAGEAAGKLPLDPGQCVLRHIVAGEVYGESASPQNEVILFASSQEGIATLLDATCAAKLEVVGMRAGPSAIVDCFAHIYRRKADAEAINLFVDPGSNCTRAIVARDGAIGFARSIPLGAASLGDAAGVSKLADELELCRRYYESLFGDRPVSRLIFVGGGAKDAARCQAIAQSMSLPAQVGDPLVRFDRAHAASVQGMDRREANPDWAVAIGLSLGAVSTGVQQRAA